MKKAVMLCLLAFLTGAACYSVIRYALKPDELSKWETYSVEILEPMNVPASQ